MKNHFNYAWWQYLTLAIAAVFGWNLIFTTTAYRPPENKRLDVYFVTYSVPTDTLEMLQTQILSMFSDLEDSNCQSIVYTSDDTYYAAMQMTAYMAAGEGDIYILCRDRFDALKQDEGFQPLDEPIANGSIDLQGIDVSSGMALDAQGAPYVAGIPASSLNGMKELGIVNDDLYICVMSNSENLEQDYEFINWLIAETYQPTENDEDQTQTDKNGASVSTMPSY